VKALFITVVVGLFAGVLCWVILVKSPAPPVIALLVLLGMVLADQAAEWLLTKRAQAKNVPPSHMVNKRKDQQNPNVQSAS
jgi:XapX domain-containing protein